MENPSNIQPDQVIVVEGDAGFVPKAEPSDAGKVLGVVNASGDVGWVEASGGQLTQVQADWAETDPAQVSYIDNKPDLSVYATSSAVDTALAGKQDVINDLSDIRAGAEAGSTAVQPSALDSYATTSAMNTALAGKQDVINDLSDIRSGASAGATAVQPAALEDYATTSAMNTALAGKQDVINDLSDIRAGAALGATAAQPSDLPSSDELLPSASSGDAGKILSVDASGNPEWITPSGGTTYSAGDGIGIDANNVISAKVDGTTIGIDSTTKEIKLLATIPTKTSDLQNDSGFITSSDIPAQVNADWTSNSGASEILHKPDLSIYAQSANLATVATTGDYDDLVNKPSIPAAQVNADWSASSGVAAILNKPSLAAVATTGAYSDLTGTPTIPTVDQTYDASSTNAQSGVAVASAISGVNAVPASTSVDSGKVLTVDSQGAPVWSNAGGTFEIIEWSSATYNLVKAAYNAGKQPVILDKTTYSSQPLYGYLVTTEMDSFFPTRVNSFRFLSLKSIGSYFPSDQSATVVQYIVPNSGQKSSSEAKVAAKFTADSSVTLTQDGIGQIKIAVANPLPASTSAEADKVLTVDSSGTPVWATAQGGNSGIYEASSTDTFADIYAANQAGKLVIYSYSGTVYTLDQLQSSDSSHTSGFIHFIHLEDNNGGLDAKSISGWTYSASATLSQLNTKDKAVIPADPASNAGKYLVANSYGSIEYATPSEVPASTSADEDKVLTVDSSGTPVWATAQGGGGTVDQTYNASSTNAQSGTAVAGALATVNQVPASTSSDEDKVLTVNSSGNPVWAAASAPYSKPLVAGSNITITDGANDVTIAATVPTVDQTYSAASTNAQSGVAVASAISGINAVPASTSADQDKVLTVNSSGTPVWAAAQGGGGSGGDSEFPYDPGYMHTGWNKMVVRFGDTSYDPTNKTSASSFTSIVALNEPGVYEYTFNLSSSHGYQLFANEWNDITNNPVDILQLTSDDQLMGSYYSALFWQCSGLRSVWNFRGYFGSASAWFRECTNLEIVSGHIPERFNAVSNPSFDDVCIKLIYDSAYMFYNCPKLKRAELVLGFTSTASSNSVLNCFRDDAQLQVGAAIVGFVASAGYAYHGCTNMTRLYGESDEPRLLYYFWDNYYPKVAGMEGTLNTNIEHMFTSCGAFSDFNGVTLRYGKVSNMEYAFDSCYSLKWVPSFNIATTNGGHITVSAENAFSMCVSLEKIPDLPYNRIINARNLFSYCWSLTDLTPLLSIATTSIDVVSGMVQGTYMVSKGALELYTALSTTSVDISSHDDTFSDCGECGWNDQRSQIPSSWGGMGA